MTAFDVTVTGHGDVFTDHDVNDNVVVLVTNRGSAEELDAAGVPRLVHVGWWAPLQLADFFGEGEQIWAGKVRFIEFDRQLEVPQEIDRSVAWRGIRYGLYPGVEVRFTVPG